LFPSSLFLVLFFGDYPAGDTAARAASADKAKRKQFTGCVPCRTDKQAASAYCQLVQLINRGSTMNLLINLIIYLVVFGLIWWLVSMLPLPAPVAQIVRVLFIILLIMIVLAAFGIIPGNYLPKLNL
jgi:Flp pilus assembly protein TadB